MNSPDLVDANRASAEIEAEAERLRRKDPEVGLLEHEIEQAWAGLAPSRFSPVAASDEGHLLDQTASLAVINPHVPIGSRRGLRGIKWLIRKLSYWYARFLTDQFNVFAATLIQHLRSLEARLGRLEKAAHMPVDNSIPAGVGLLNDPPEPSLAVASLVAGLAGSGPCLVLSGGQGAIVETIDDRGISAHGVEQDSDRVLAGLRRRIDIRAGDVLAHLVGSEEEEFGTIVLTGIVETLPLKDLVGMVNQVSLKLEAAGRIIVAVADPAMRGRVDSELGSGLGISPVTWRHLLERAGFDTRLEPCPDSRITEIVVAQRTASPSLSSTADSNQSKR